MVRMGEAVQMGQSKVLAYKTSIAAWALALIWGMACPAIASNPQLREIRFEKGENGEERVLFVLNGNSPPQNLCH